MQRSIPRDLGLTVRIAFVTLLLVCIYAAVLALLVQLVRSDPRDPRSWLAALLVCAGLGAFILNAPTAALSAVRARDPKPGEYPELHAALDRLAAMAATPAPKLAISDNRTPNSFAVGVALRRPTIVVTVGLMEMLTPAEVEAVLGHELTHIVNRDAFTVTAASAFPIIGAWLGRWRFEGYDYTKREIDDLREYLILPFELFFGGILYLVGSVLTLAISRYREYVADRGSAFLTGSPEQLMSALQKLGDAHARIPARDLRAVRRLNALCVVSTSRKPGFLSRDHPPIEQRIAALAEIARELSSRAV